MRADLKSEAASTDASCEEWDDFVEVELRGENAVSGERLPVRECLDGLQLIVYMVRRGISYELS